jgi:hypothetical protein
VHRSHRPSPGPDAGTVLRFGGSSNGVGVQAWQWQWRRQRRCRISFPSTMGASVSSHPFSHLAAGEVLVLFRSAPLSALVLPMSPPPHPSFLLPLQHHSTTLPLLPLLFLRLDSLALHLPSYLPRAPACPPAAPPDRARSRTTGPSPPVWASSAARIAGEGAPAVQPGIPPSGVSSLPARGRGLGGGCIAVVGRTWRDMVVVGPSRGSERKRAKVTTERASDNESGSQSESQSECDSRWFQLASKPSRADYSDRNPVVSLGSLGLSSCCETSTSGPPSTAMHRARDTCLYQLAYKYITRTCPSADTTDATTQRRNARNPPCIAFTIAPRPGDQQQAQRATVTGLVRLYCRTRRRTRPRRRHHPGNHAAPNAPAKLLYSCPCLNL